MNYMGKDMDKKILIIGSIIAAVVIVLASLSPVVGYNTVKSSIKDSPLFNVRISRAIDKEQGGILSNYIGKGIKINILLPTRNENNLNMQKLLVRISKLSDEELESFIQIVIQKAYEEKLNFDEEIIIDALNRLKKLNLENIGELSDYFKNLFEGKEITNNDPIIICYPVPFFIFKYIILIFLLILDFFLIFLTYYEYCFPFLIAG